MNFLDHVGSVLKKIFHIGEEAAIIARPFIDVAFPEIAPLYNSAFGLMGALQAAVVSTPGAGTLKLAALVSAMTPQIEAFTKANNIQWSKADIEKWASLVVETVKLIPAPSAPAAPITLVPAAAAVATVAAV